MLPFPRCSLSFFDLCHPALSHTTTIVLSGYFRVRSVRAFTMLEVFCQSNRMRSTLPSASWRNPI